MGVKGNLLGGRTVKVTIKKKRAMRRHPVKRLIFVGVLTILFMQWVILPTSKTDWFAKAWGAGVSIKAILENPERYDGQKVTIQGKVSAIKHRTSKRGNQYTTFDVTDASGGPIKVFTWGWPKISNGDRVEVTGIFQRVKRVGRYIFYNEIEATSIRQIGK